MGRIHAFELEDQPWCPGILRDGGTAYITRFLQLTGLMEGALPHLRKVLDAGDGPWIDLCSGAGGPAGDALHRLRADRPELTVECTDLFPNVEGLAHEAAKHDGAMRVCSTPVDATAVGGDRRGPRTLFNALHHFRPEQARAILADAVAARAPIGAFEFVGRQPHAIPGMLGVPLAVMCLVPFLRPFRWGWIPLTYLVPLLPLLVWWDGAISCLRVYSPDELRALVVGLDDYDWDFTNPEPLGDIVTAEMRYRVERELERLAGLDEDEEREEETTTVAAVDAEEHDEAGNEVDPEADDDRPEPA